MISYRSDVSAHGIAEIVNSARSKGVRLWSQRGELRYRAPKGALTPEELTMLGTRKAEIIAFLESATELSVPPLQPRSDRGAVPLTFSQLAHWHANDLGHQTSVRNLTFSVSLRGRLDPGLLRESLLHAVQRHEILRTGIVILDGQPMQESRSSTQCELRSEDFRSVSKEARAAAVTHWIHRLILQPIRVTEGPLLEVGLARLEADRYVLAGAMEHLISDAYSANVLAQDILRSYVQLDTGVPAHLPAVGIQYSDYAAWQRLAHPWWLRTHGEYWQEHLRGCERMRFPSHRVTPDRMDCCWAMSPIRIDRELKVKLVEWSRTHQTTLVMTVFTAYLALVSRWCNTGDILVRYQTDGRFSPEVANTIGFFASMLHLRIQLHEQDTFLDLLRRATLEYCEAYEHHDFSYIDAQVPAVDYTRSSCFNWVARTLENDDADDSRREPCPLEIAPWRFPRPSSASREQDSDPVVLLHDTEHEIVGHVHFPSAGFTQELMDRFARNLMSALAALRGRPQDRVHDLALIA